MSESQADERKSDEESKRTGLAYRLFECLMLLGSAIKISHVDYAHRECR